MTSISARTFWERYREALRVTGTRSASASDPAWTAIGKAAAEAACKDLGLLIQREYLRLDVMGYTYRGSGDDFDWDLRVAFEHENCSQKGKDWCGELCKLTHIVADLRVLVGYFNHHRGSLEHVLNSRVKLMGERMTRVPGSEWLLIFGPSMPRPGDRFSAFTLAGDLSLKLIDDPQPLMPIEWRPM
jgi:hypothetical protein